jgi:hypothetical protein
MNRQTFDARVSDLLTRLGLGIGCVPTPAAPESRRTAAGHLKLPHFPRALYWDGQSEIMPAPREERFWTAPETPRTLEELAAERERYEVALAKYQHRFSRAERARSRARRQRRRGGL